MCVSECARPSLCTSTRQLITAIPLGASEMFLWLHQFPQLLSHLSRLLTEASQWERSAWHSDKKQPQTQAVGLQQRQSLTPFPSQTIHFSSSLRFFLFSARSSAFCFNSSPIMSRVPHKVLISSLPPESAKLTRTHVHKFTQECMCAYTRPQILMRTIHTLASQTHAYVLRGYMHF